MWSWLDKGLDGINMEFWNNHQLGHVLQLKLIWPIEFKYSTKPLSDKC